LGALPRVRREREGDVSKRIAPTLTHVVGLLNLLPDLEGADAVACRAELRALLAVARAARRFTEAENEDQDAMAFDATRRALIRLDKVSK